MHKFYNLFKTKEIFIYSGKAFKFRICYYFIKKLIEKDSIRSIDYNFLKRTMIWGIFSEFLLFILTLISNNAKKFNKLFKLILYLVK